MPEVAYCPECNQPVVVDAEACNHCGAEVGPGLDRADIWHGLRDKLAAATRDNYEVDGLIGYGGMAGVYLAKDTRLNRHVALKLITPAVLMDPKMVRRFRQEAQTMAQLNHRHIVPVYDIRESDDLLFIVMQYVPGRTLAEVVTDSKERLAPELVATWMIQISEALAHAHGRPTAVIHRDIKPSNIILDETGEAQLTDFGIAKVQGDAGLTRTGHLIGTPAYMSPEQCRGGAITAASDQYSLGTVAYELLAGVPPFRGPTLMVLQAHSGEEPKKLVSSRPECPSALATVVERMLAKSPEDRWPDMAAVSRALREAVGDPVPSTTLQSWAKRVREIGLETRPTPLTLGTSERLIPRLLDSEGVELEGRRVHWATTDGGVASVSTDGVLGAKGVGSAVIVGRSGAAVTTLEVEVIPERVAVAALSLAGHWAPMRLGEERVAECSVLGTDDAVLADRVVEWSSSDAEVARVDSAGKVAAVSEGAATVVATCEGISASFAIEVVGPIAAAADQTQVIQGVDWGAPQDLRPPVTSEAPAFVDMPELAEPPAPTSGDQELTRVLTPTTPPQSAPHAPLSGFDKTNVIRPDELGQMEGAKGGAAPAAPVASPSPAVGPISATPWPRVGAGVGGIVLLAALIWGLGGRGQALPILALTVLPGDTSVQVGDEFRLRAGVAAGELRGRNPVWTSSDPAVAVVSAAGIVEAVAPGMAAISLNGDGIETDGPWALTVVPLGELVADVGDDESSITPADESAPDIPASTLDDPPSDPRPASPTPEEERSDPPPQPAPSQPAPQVPSRLILDVTNRELDVGQGRLLSAVILDQDGRAMPPDELNWSSSSPDAVTVNPDGGVVGVSGGSAWIVATRGSLRDSIQLAVAEVEAPPPVDEPPPLGAAPPAAEAEALIAGFASSLGGDGNRLLALIPVADRGDHERYVTFISEGRLEASGAVQGLSMNGTRATFALPVRGRTAFGSSREGSMSFVAEIGVVEGAWALVRVLPAPGSTPP